MKAGIMSSACPRAGLRAPRTLNEAFGPTAVLETRREAFADRMDRLIGRLCCAIVLVLAAASGYWYGWTL
jgi:hypothetical protein